MSVLQKLTEGVIQRDVSREGQALLNKWEQTGLLEGLDSDRKKQGMACLLENQAKELLREASSMAAGDVEGFAAVAFPIVRRVFGGLIANDLVSVQPMSLPSGLIFFLDFTHEDSNPMGAGQSIYGGNIVGSQLTGGVNLSPTDDGRGPGGFYDMGLAVASPTGSTGNIAFELLGAAGGGGAALANPVNGALVSALDQTDKKVVRFDPDLLADEGAFVSVIRSTDPVENIAELNHLDRRALHLIRLSDRSIAGEGAGHSVQASYEAAGALIRRLTTIDSDGRLRLVFQAGATFGGIANGNVNLIIPLADEFAAGDGLGSVVGAQAGGPGGWALEEPSPSTGRTSATRDVKNTISEIDIKVESIAVTAKTKKLKAKWTPELGQDLNAYHNLDAEVELTGILSEQIALEIDRELLNELVEGATAGTRYWSRAPGLFVDSNGNETGAVSAAPDFTGTVSEWYETLIETINDVSAQIHRKTLRGGANFVVCSPEVANILEFTSGFRASVTADQDRGTIGAVKAGSLSKKFDVYVDPYFLRNVVLVGRKGSSFLESGFVYAPYVPLQVTPTIFGTEDFVPRKGVMTRYAKKMVRPDMYGLVVVRGLLGESGSSVA